MEVTTRREAIERGLTRYFTGEPCKRGHVAERSVTSAQCRECYKEDKKHYRKTNPIVRDKHMAAIAKWRQKKSADPEWRAKERERLRAYLPRIEDPEVARRRRQRFKANHPEKYRQQQRRRRSMYYARYPEKKRAVIRNYFARKRGAKDTHTAAEVQRILSRQGKRCVYCKASLAHGYHVDHIIPLSKGGGNGPENLQCLCAPCNLSKSDKLPEVFAQSIGMLL